MSETIPGGRQRASSEGDILDDDEGEAVFYPAGSPLNSSHRKVSRSAVLTTGHCVRQTENDNDDYSDDERRVIGPSERRRKSRKSFRSIKKFMNRVMRHTSSATAIHQQDVTTNPRITWTPTLRRRGGEISGENHEYWTLRNGRKPDREMSESTSRPLITDPNFGVPKWEKTPGTVGLYNHGNTCFMNAVLQCLGNTDSFMEYFIELMYKEDLKNSRNNAKKYGTKGEVTEHLGILLRCLWSRRYHAQISGEFKSIVGKFNPQYKGTSQNDAQEFLLWLLDKLHEDLNSGLKRKTKPIKSTSTKSDEELAHEAQNNSDGSFVSQLFQALHRSSLMCPHCGKQSNTFDPYLCVSLPLPQKCPRPVYVNVVSLNSKPQQVRIGLKMNAYDTVKDLRKMISLDTQIPLSQLLLCQIGNDGFKSTYCDNQPLTDIHDSETVYAIEMFPSNHPTSASAHYETPFVQIVVVHTERISTPHGLYRFCSPEVIEVSREIQYRHLQQELLHWMGDAVKPEVFSQKLNVLFRLRVVDGSAKSYLPTNVDMPLFTQAVDRALTQCRENSGPTHIKLVAEWEPHVKAAIIQDDEDQIEEHTSVHQVRMSQQQNISATLDECFKLYTQEEKLNGEDAWLCPYCKKQQQGTIKTLGLWSLPEVLVIHLKRFKQIGQKRNKMNTLVNFPINNLNMAKHVVQRQESATQNGYPGFKLLNSKGGPASFRSEDDVKYDLFAVCNHYGNMSGGHYTAFCKSPIDNVWHEYDDTRVKTITESQVISKAAYLLFYQRRSLTKLCNQNLHTGNHWVFRMFSNNNIDDVDSSSPSSPKTVHFDTSSPQQIPRGSVPPNPPRQETNGKPPIARKPILRPLTPQPVRKQTFTYHESDYSDRKQAYSYQENNHHDRKQHFTYHENDHHDQKQSVSYKDSDYHDRKPISTTSQERDYHDQKLISTSQERDYHDRNSNTRGQERDAKVEVRVHAPVVQKAPETTSHSQKMGACLESSSSVVRNGREEGSPPSHKNHPSRALALNQNGVYHTDGPKKQVASPKEDMIHSPLYSPIMVVESRQITEPSPVKAESVQPARSQPRPDKPPELRSSGSTSIPRQTDEATRQKYATIARVNRAQIDDLIDSVPRGMPRSKTDNTITTSVARPPQQQYSRRRHTDASVPDHRDSVSISSYRTSRSRSNQDAISVRSFGSAAYNGYGRRDTSASRGDIRYRPHIHRGNMLAQMQARKSFEIPAPCLKESSV